eukprot:1161021-Pelagomonas_calceolata.AAC.5
MRMIYDDEEAQVPKEGVQEDDLQGGMMRWDEGRHKEHFARKGSLAYLWDELSERRKAVPEKLVVEQGHEDSQVHVDDTYDNAHLHLHTATGRDTQK